MEVFQGVKWILRSSWRWIVLLLLGSLLIVGCEREGQLPTETAVPELTTPVIPATQIPIRNTDTPAPAPTANFMGVRFVYDSDLIGQLSQSQHKSMQPATGTNPHSLAETIQFSFGDQPTTQDFSPHNAKLFIFPKDQYAAISAEAAEQITKLENLLNTRQLEVETALPMLPLPTGKETFHSQPNYVEFENGLGLSYITQYDLEPNFITNQDIFYTFQGITDDGEFYIAGFFPIDNISLPDDQNGSDSSILQDSKSWKAYQSKTVNTLNTAPDDEFKPELSSLDRMMASLHVQPEEPFPADLMPTYTHFSGVTLGYDPSLISTTTSELVPAHYHAENQPPKMLAGVPDMIQFDLMSNGGQQKRPSTLTINPIRDPDGNFYASLPEAFTQKINALETHLTTNQSQPLPGQTHSHRLNFQSGIGTRALVYQPQNDTTPIHYTFAGITHDGKYYVNYTHPLDGPELLNEDAEADLETILAALQNQPLAAFQPDINDLDQMLQSLAIASEASTQSSIPANPANCHNAATFVGDVNFPDDEIVERGDFFTKIWRLRNSGECTWTPAYQVVFDEGDDLVWQQHDLLKITPPGKTVDVSVTLLSPEEAGIYQTWFRLIDETGQPFDERFYVQFEAPEPAQTLPDFGAVEGKISYPAGIPPAITIYFLRTDGQERYALETEAGWTRYANSIPVGEYHVFARVTGETGDFGGGYTHAVECGLTANCTDHTLSTVLIEDGKTARNIDITDWYAPAGTFPLPTD